MLRLLLCGDAMGLGMVGFGFREYEYQLTSHAFCSHCLWAVVFHSSSLAFSAADTLFDSPVIHALFTLFFCQPHWQLFIPPRGIGTRDLSLANFPICPHAWMQTRHLPAPRFLCCMCVQELQLYFSGKSDFVFSPDEFSPSSSSRYQAQCWDWPGLTALGRNIWAVKIHTRHGMSWVMLHLHFIQWDLLVSVCTSGSLQCSPAVET